jgi:hypothetical protein
MTTTTTDRFTLIDAEGCYGDYCYDWRTYPTLAAASAAARSGHARIVTGCTRGEGEKVAAAGVAALIARGDWKVVR